MPDAEEMRMVRAIERTALCEALRLGTYNACFRGFHIYAMRQSVQFGAFVSITVAFGVTKYVADVMLSLDPLGDRFVLPAQSRDESYAFHVQEPIACVSVR